MSVELNDITSGYSTGLINDNFQSLEAYINNKLLNRDGLAIGETNQMEVGLDMNSNYVYNLPEPVLEHQAARLQDVQNALAGGSANLITFTPYGSITSTNVQGAIQELSDEVARVFNTVSNMDEDSSLTIGDRVRTLGYLSLGDGGGNDYEIVGAGTGSNDGGTFIDLSGSGLQARGLFTAPTADALQWGATTKAFYVDPAGDDNDVGSSSAPFATLQKAADALAEFGPFLKNNFQIIVGAGSYPAGFRMSRLSSDGPIDIIGADVGGHPNVPTSIIDASLTGGDNTDDMFFLSQNSLVRFYDIKVQNVTSGGAWNYSKQMVTLFNCHTENTKFPFTAVHDCFTTIRGGLHDGNNIADSAGVQEFYGCTHSIESNSLATAVLFSNFDKGMQINEGAFGHLDFTRIHDCNVGVWFNRVPSSSNTSQMQIYRCGIGVQAYNSSWFNNGIDFGLGTANACTVAIDERGDSPEYDYRCSDFSSRALRQQATNPGLNVSGTAAETTLWEMTAIRQGMVSAATGSTAHSTRVKLFFEHTLTANCSVRLYLNSTFLVGTQIDSGETMSVVEFDIFYQTPNSQKGSVCLTQAGGSKLNFDVTSVDNNATLIVPEITVQLGASGDSITCRYGLMDSTPGG